MLLRDANVTVDRPSSVGFRTSKSKRDITATSSAPDNQFLTSRQRSESKAASNVAAEVSMPVVHSLSHVVVEDERSSKAPEVSYRRRQKKLKKKISVAGDKQQKALTS